jgi:FKBP-type peptidyl-prolyl cis-trans isomerase FklB
MKLHYIALAAGMTFFSACNQKQKDNTSTTGPKELKTKMDSLNYAFGIDIGNSLKSNGMEGVNPQLIQQGITEVLDTTVAESFTKEEAQEMIQGFFRELAQQKQEEERKKYESNKEIGAAFLEENKSKAGVVALSNGLQYEVIKEGTGAKPTVNDKVTVHYHGTLIDGKVFDSSVERGQPATFGLRQVIPGWTEILQLMPTGSKWKVYIPQEMAYGERGMRDIKPFSTLIFDIELLEIVKEDAATAAHDGHNHAH